MGGPGGREGEKESAAQRQEVRRAGEQGCSGQLRDLSRRQGQGGWRGGRRAQPEAGGLDVEEGAGRKRRRALLEDLQWPRSDAPLEASSRAGSLSPHPLYPLAEVGAGGLVGRPGPTDRTRARRRA